MPSYFLRPDETSRHEIFPGVCVNTAPGDQMMLSLVEMEPGAIVQPHSHPHEQMGMLLEGELDFRIGEERRKVRPGDMWRIPGGVEHEATAVGGRVRALDVFYPVREDYL
ncbi:MAG: cupin domain-containing protein [Pirellulales bacterium]